MSTIYSTTEYRTRLDRAPFRARKVYRKAIKIMRAALGPKAKISRLNALQLAAGALETGSRAFGIAKPWPKAAEALRQIQTDLKAGLPHAEMMRTHSPQHPDTIAAADLGHDTTLSILIGAKP